MGEIYVRDLDHMFEIMLLMGRHMWCFSFMCQDQVYILIKCLTSQGCIFYTGTPAKGEGEAIENMYERGGGEIKRSVNPFFSSLGNKTSGEKWDILQPGKKINLVQNIHSWFLTEGRSGNLKNKTLYVGRFNFSLSIMGKW